MFTPFSNPSAAHLSPELSRPTDFFLGRRQSARPVVDICRFPAKSRCVTNPVQCPVSCLPRPSQPASLHRHTAPFISLSSDAVSDLCLLFIHSVWVFAPSSTHPFASRSPFHSDSWLVPASAPPLRLADVAIVSLQILPSPSQTTFPPQRRLTLPSTKA